MRLVNRKSIHASIYILALLYTWPVHAQRPETPKTGPAQVGIMSFEEYVKRRHTVPYILKLNARKGRLLYFGAKHVSNTKDPELAQIEKLWAKFKPDVAFFEGGDPDYPPPVAKSREEVDSESSLVRFLAARDNVPVQTLEPSRGDEIAHLLKTYTPEEVKLFYVLRQLSQFKQGDKKEDIQAYIENVLRWISLRPELKGAPRTIVELGESSARLLPKLADWQKVPQAWFDPAPRASPQTYLNHVSRQLSELRDRHMLRLLTEQLSQDKRVFAVVGASHVVMQERAIRAALKPRLKN